MDEILKRIIGKSPLEVCNEGLAAVANQLITEGAVHICGTRIVEGKSKVTPPLLVAPCISDSLADYLSQ